MRFDPLDFPQRRTAPEGVVRELEAMDWRYGLLHSRGHRWLLCRYEPEHVDRAAALEGLQRWRSLIVNGTPYSEETHVRIRQHRLALHGWTQVAVYVVRHDSFGFLVNDVRAARWKAAHTSESEMFSEIDAAEYERREAAIADIRDRYRAQDAWHYAFTRTHTTSVSLTPPDKPKSGFVRHSIPKPDTSHAA